MNLLGAIKTFVNEHSTTIEEIEEADRAFNERRAAGDEDGQDAISHTMYRKGYVPHYDRDTQTFYFVDKA